MPTGIHQFASALSAGDVIFTGETCPVAETNVTKPGMMTRLTSTRRSFFDVMARKPRNPLNNSQ